MQRIRKFLSVLLAIMMVISVFPITASAVTSGDWTYSVISEADKTAQITGYSGTETNLKIPSMIDGYTITSIGNNAFQENATITHVTIPEGITSIGRYAFYKCEALERVVIPDGVKTISYAAFDFCTNLTNVEIPVSVTSIEDYAFSYCFDLKVIFYAGTKEQWNAIKVGSKGTIEFNSATVFYECENSQLLSGTCGENAIWSLNVVTGVLTISGTGDMATYNAITSFVPWSKCKSLIKKVVVNDGITSISSKAFYDCTNLTSVSIPTSVTKIGTDAFRNCANIASINVDSNNEYYSNDQYGVLFNKDKTRLIKYAGGNGQTDYTIPDTVLYVNANAFANCLGIYNVVIPDSVTNVYANAFLECRKLESVTIGNGLTEVADYTFKDCWSLKNVEIGNSVTTLGEQAFYGCSSLKQVVIPESVTTLDKRVFEECSNLEAVLIPKSITTISWGVFDECTDLVEVYYTGTEEEWASVTIENYNDCLKTAKIHYNADHIHAYTSVYTEATCTKSEYYTYTCECGYSYIKEYGTPNGHTPADNGVVTREPTCSLEGEKTFTCEVCGETYTEAIDCLSHTKVKIPAVAPTPTSTGLTEGSKCSVCGEILVAQQVVPMLAVSGTCGDNLTWVFDIETYTLTISGTGDMSNCTSYYHPWMDYENEIKKIVVEDGVTSIGAYAFYNYSWVKEVDLPDTLERIGDYALYGCSMPTINLADTLTTIGQCAFKNCDDLTEIIIPEGVTEISTGAFERNTNLTKVTLPSTLTTIGGEAFFDCDSLESIDIPDNVTSIGGNAFYSCNKLKGIEIPEGVSKIGNSTFYGCTALEKVILHEGLSEIGDSAFMSCRKLVSINFPSTLETIGTSAFRETGLTSITIPAHIISFGAQVFAECPNLIDATFEDGVTVIAKEMFYKCTALKNVYIPNTITQVNANAFDGCTALENVYLSGGLEDWLGITFDISNAKSQPLYYADNLYFNNELVTEVVIPETVTIINTYAFYNYDKLTSVKIPSTVNRINKSAFAACSNLTDLTIEEGVKTFGSFVFSDCDALTSVTIPASITSIGNNVFEECDTLTKAVFAEGCTTTGVKTFYSCDALKEVVLPTSMKTIGSNAFAYCKSLETISIPKNVTSIGTKAFEYCNALTNITVDDENQQYSSEDGVLFNKNKTEIIHYPIGKPETRYTIPDSVKTIPEYIFAYSSLTNVIIPTSVEKIYGYAFYKCDDFTDIYYKGTRTQWNAITKDDYYDRYLGKAILHCGYPAGDYEYTVISEADKTIRLEKYNLYDSATNLVIPSTIDGYTVTEIGPSAFESRTQFKNIIIPETVTKIGERAFYQCAGITKIIIPESVIEISANAFYGCTKLEKVLFNDGINKIGIGAFNNCTKLSDVYYTGTAEQWNTIKISTDNNPLINATKHFGYTDDYVTDSGTCGDNLTWALNAFTGVLTISGTGDMYDYTSNSKAPWYNYRNSIEKVVICEGVTSIGEYAFYNCTTFKNISMADSVTTIGSRAFYNCNSLTDIVIGKGVKELGYYTFYCCSALKTITFDKNVKRIHQYVVGSCSNLTDVYYLGSWDDWGNTSVGYNCFWPGEIHILGDDTHKCSKEYIYDSVVTAPTCTEQGYTTYTCRCGKTYIDDYVDAIGHNYNSVVTPPTCMDQGFTTHTCTICGDTHIDNYVDPTNAIDGHTTVVIPAKLPTKTDAGYTRDERCSACGKVFVESQAVPALNDESFARLQGENIIGVLDKEARTLTIYGTGTIEDGYALTSAFDAIFGIQLGYASFVDIVIIKDGITGIGDEAFKGYPLDSVIIPDSVTTIGESAFYGTDIDNITIGNGINIIDNNAFGSCDLLAIVYYAGTEAQWQEIKIEANNQALIDAIIYYNGIRPHIHNYSSVVTDPTCTKRGYTTHTCLDCGDNYVDSYVDALGHRYNADVTEATCTENGYTTYTCECGDSYINDYVGAIGHSCDEWELVSEPTCQIQGTEKGACSTCGAELTQRINALGHDFGELELEYDATCTNEGRYSRACSRCGSKTNIEIIPAIGHNYGEWVQVDDAKCGEYGRFEHFCSTCNGIEVMFSPTEHNYSIVVEHIEPTCTTDGIKTVKCEDCGRVSSEVLPATGHNYTVEEVHSEATCTTPGCKTQYCSCCNYVNEVITPAMGHSYTSQVIKPATYTTEGVELLTCFCGEQEYKIIEKLSVSDNQMVILITGKEDASKENVNKENVNKENVNKENISKEDIGKEDIGKEDISIEGANNPYVPTTTSKTVLCVLLLLVFTAVAYIPTHAISVQKRRKK